MPLGGDGIRTGIGGGGLRTGLGGGIRDPGNIGPPPLQSYIPDAVDQERTENTRRSFLEGVFDLVSMGQYVTANVAEDITDLVRGDETEGVPIIGGIGSGIKAAVTGRGRKGDWENVLWGDPDEGPNDGWFRTESKVLRRGTGFLANVLLDPTTYLTGGATAAGRSAGKAFAQQAVKNAARRGRHFQQGKQAAREMDRVYNAAVRRAQRTDPGTLRKEMVDELVGDRARLQSRLDEMLGGAPARPGKRFKGEVDELKGEIAGVDEDIARFARIDELAAANPAFDMAKKRGGDLSEGLEGRARSDAEYWEELGLRGAGERSKRFFGMDIPGTTRQGGLNPVHQQMVEIGDMIRNAPRKALGGDSFADAWWTKMNTGVIGAIRQRFGFRNPYQRALREIELSNEQAQEIDGLTTFRSLDNMLTEFTPEDIQAAGELAIRGEAWSIEKVGKVADGETGPTLAELIDNPEFVAGLPEEVLEYAGEGGALMGVRPAAVQAFSRIKQGMDELLRQENEWAAAGLVAPSAKREIYLPLQMKLYREGPRDVIPADESGTKLGQFDPSHTHGRSGSHLDARNQEAARLSFVTGMSREEALDAMKEGTAGLYQADVVQMLAMRARVHAKMKARAGLISSLREFGVQVDSLPTRTPDMDTVTVKEAKEAMKRREGLREVGLFTVDDPATEGWVFDAEVTDILNRSLKVTETPEAMNAFRKAVKGYTAFWKAGATLSAGFHAQNIWSNTTMMFMRIGPKAFSKRLTEESAVGTAYAIGGGLSFGLDKVAEKVGGKARVQAILNRQRNGKTIREHAEYAHRQGIINEFASRTGDAPANTITGEAAPATMGQRINPLSDRFAPVEASRQFGTFVESAQRFHLYMGNLEQVAGKHSANKMEQEWAKLEAKKWLVDYADMTEMERNVMVPLMPFYRWTRRSVPLYMKQIIEDPASAAAVSKGRQALQGEREDSDMPKWLRERGAVLIGDEDPMAVTMPTGFRMLDLIPFEFGGEGEAPIPRFKGGMEVLREAAGMAHPALRVFVEGSGKRDLFFDREIAEGSKALAPSLLQTLRATPEILPVLDGLSRIFGGEGTSFQIDADGRVRMNASMVNVLNESAPVVNQLAKLLAGPAWAIEEFGVELPGALEDAIDPKGDEYSGMLRFLRAAGVRLRRFDPEAEELARAQAAVDRASQQRRHDRQGMIPFNSDQWNQQRRQRYQRLGAL